MKVLSQFFLLSALCSSATCLAEELVEIPLSSIWSYRMPGAKGLPGGGYTGRPFDRRENDAVQAIRAQLKQAPPAGQQAQGFVVAGPVLDALEEAGDVLAESEKHRSVFTDDEELWAFFFAYNNGSSYRHVHSVDRHGENVFIDYHAVAHVTMDDSEHFALIPLGQLKPMRYKVSVRYDYIGGERVAKKRTKEIDESPFISGSFVFEVVDR